MFFARFHINKTISYLVNSLTLPQLLITKLPSTLSKADIQPARCPPSVNVRDVRNGTDEFFTKARQAIHVRLS